MELIKVSATSGKGATRNSRVKLSADESNGNAGNLKSMGWVPDLPDVRDYTPEHDIVKPDEKQKGVDESVKQLLFRIGIKGPQTDLPQQVDLRRWFSPIEDQGNLGSCTANAGVALLEYYERRAFGKHIDASRLFLYKATRNLLHWKGDTGAYLRTTMKAMALFGVPPEDYCPYKTENFDEEPGPFCYAFASNYQSINYYRLDLPGLSRKMLLDQIKTNIAKEQPTMFGFTVYSSIAYSNQNGEISFPLRTESVEGGHAVVAVGYDDNKIIHHHSNPRAKTKGAFLIRNSWGTGWGLKGYGWLPYDYVLAGIAVDWWCLIASKWFDTGVFDDR